MQIHLKVLHFENIANFVGNTDLSYLPSLNLSMQIPIFTSPGLSLIRVMTMTAGGVDFDSIFASMNSEPFLTYLLWVVFLVLMPVLLANLLVSNYVEECSMPIARKRKHHYGKSLLKCLRAELFGVDDCRQLLLQD